MKPKRNALPCNPLNSAFDTISSLYADLSDVEEKLLFAVLDRDGSSRISEEEFMDLGSVLMLEFVNVRWLLRAGVEQMIASSLLSSSPHFSLCLHDFVLGRVGLSILFPLSRRRNTGLSLNGSSLRSIKVMAGSTFVASSRHRSSIMWSILFLF